VHVLQLRLSHIFVHGILLHPVLRRGNSSTFQRLFPHLICHRRPRFSSFYIPCVVMVLLYWRIFHTIRQRTRKSVATAAAASLASSATAQQHRKSTPTSMTDVNKVEMTTDGRKSMPSLATNQIVAVTELTVTVRPEKVEPEVEIIPIAKTELRVEQCGNGSGNTQLDETAVTELTVAATAGSDEAEPEPETGQLLLDMTSSAIETRRRQRRRPCDDGSSDADRETALIAHVNCDEIAQLSSDSCQNSKQ